MRLHPLAALLVGAGALCGFAAQPPIPSYKGPIHAQLLKRASARSLKAGSSFFVRVSEDWSGLGCTLRKGAIIEASVEKAVPRIKHGRASELALSFSKAQCGGVEMAPLELFLAAISYVPPDSNADSYPGVRYMFSPANSTMGPGAVPGGNLPAVAASSQETLFTKGDEFKGMKKGPTSFTPGGVYGIKDITMKLDAGPRHSSLLTAEKRDVVLEENTEFILVPTSLVAASAAGAPASPSPALRVAADIPAISSAAPPARIGFQPCAPPSCTTDLSAAAQHAEGGPVESIAIDPLGYAPRPQEAIAQLNHDQALVWLAPTRLLVAFNPHRLIYREGLSTADAPQRTIRAVLLDTAAKQVVSMADWELSDDGEYVWQISGGRVLVHAGSRLHVYDSQLQLQSELPLAGRLQFLRISPNGEIIAVGVVKERHSAQLHRRLRKELGQDPQEDVAVTILDKDFKLIASGSTTSDVLPPTLLNEGQLNVLREPNHGFRLSLLTWKGGDETLARFASGCRPRLATLAPDLALLRTCEPVIGAPQIHILRPGGDVVLVSQPDADEIGQEAKGNPSSQTFALKVLKTAAAIPDGSIFKGSDLSAVELRVYRAKDGKRLATLRAKAPAPGHDGYCLSPDGSQVAVLAGGQVHIFPVPPQ